MIDPRFVGRKFLCFLLCISCLLCCTPPVQAIETTPADGQTLTTLVRMAPKSDGPVIGQLEDGTKLSVLSSSGSFYKVDCYDMVGYIAQSQVLQKDSGEYYVNCEVNSSETQLLTYWSHSQALELRHSLLASAKKQLGGRYVYGSMRPGAFDCSGLTGYLYKQHGIALQRRASLQLQDGIVVPREAMQVGDLVFFREGAKYPATHVGIYTGNGQMIHAGVSGGVEYASLDVSYYAKYFLCVRRVVCTAGVQEPMPMARGVATTLVVNSVSGRSIS